jgi:hypothetical protein
MNREIDQPLAVNIVCWLLIMTAAIKITEVVVGLIVAIIRISLMETNADGFMLFFNLLVRMMTSKHIIMIITMLIMMISAVLMLKGNKSGRILYSLTILPAVYNLYNRMNIGVVVILVIQLIILIVLFGKQANEFFEQQKSSKQKL